jgi:hypothetical protein
LLTVAAIILTAIALSVTAAQREKKAAPGKAARSG